MIYLDASALVKLIAPEPESSALSEWVLARRQHARTTSAISRAEVLRALRAEGPAAEDLASIVLSKIEQLPVDDAALDAATAIRLQVDPLQALHLGTAVSRAEGLHAYVSYEPVLLAAAADAGLRTASPGSRLAAEP
ncbi:PIN domain-containing protein [Saccharopolyspora sp. HNM0983]|uniref:Ribonuclease VapC n=1 Tax=Saccharopolyspora montiporae TaxID=2781240 RepID=A0A929FZG4_9PSEU|nr:PIN domain-containing protein [Saccharopolyspora sp. HNM0983]MBE9374349.1 PIN domain-containing protein [Saccharopolyspora sp. HNM0983]